jgi:GTP pyrophosphokinase
MSISKSQVDKAGGALRDWWDDPVVKPDLFPRDAGSLIWDYRRQFSYPMTKINANLRHYVRTAGAPIIIAQRLKRLPRIIEKLSRHPRMRLSQMQDIGGCRAILPNQAAADNVLAGLQRNWEIITIDDYTKNPRPTGYRGHPRDRSTVGGAN